MIADKLEILYRSTCIILLLSDLNLKYIDFFT